MVPGAHCPPPRPRRKGRDSRALLEGLAEVLLPPSPSPAVPSLSCQLLPGPARGWEVEKAVSPGEAGHPPSHPSDSWTEGARRWAEGIGCGHQEVTVRRAGCLPDVLWSELTQASPNRKVGVEGQGMSRASPPFSRRPRACLRLHAGRQLVWTGGFVPHIEVVHQGFRQAGRCSDGLSPPLLWGREGDW